MGALCSGGDSAMTKEEKRQNEKVSENLVKDKVENDRIKKLLLLGPGESGKSTLFKQMIKLYTEGWSEQKRTMYKGTIKNHIMEAIMALLRQVDERRADGTIFVTLVEQYHLDEETQVARKIVEQDHMDVKAQEATTIRQETIDAIVKLWTSPVMKKIYADRANFQLPDNSEYFFSNVRNFEKADYLPSDSDILRCRVRTTGIIETQFTVEKNPFLIVDVGGQRTERKKWIHCFSNVTAVLFVCALSEYNQQLFEDETANRMTEAITLFEEILGNDTFKDTPIILFFNKNDLFLTKVKQVPLTVCPSFKDYDGPELHKTEEEIQYAKDYIEKKFTSASQNSKRAIYVKHTTAVDPDNIKHVMNSVADIVIQGALMQGGLLEVDV